MVFGRFFRDLALGVKRSSQWRRVRADHVKEYYICACCGGTKKLEVHHIKPVHLFPELELEPMNLITLCSRMKCHFIFGHLYNWESYNITIEEDLKVWKTKIIERP